MTGRGRPPPRPEIAALRPYRPSRSLPPVRLHANESPYPPPGDVMDEIARGVRAADLNRYPDIEATELRAEIADYAGVPIDWVWVGTGSNEILLNAALAYGGAGRTALLFTPTYAMHRLQATIAGTRVETFPRGDGFSLSPERARDALDRVRPDIAFLCSPDNPTGVLTPSETLEAIAGSAPGLVVVDEAYHEFSGVTFVPRLDRFGNVIVVRTLSKAFGLAGVRLGYAIAQPSTLEPLIAVRMPYGQSALAQVAATVVLRRRAEVLAHVADIVAERERVTAALSGRAGYVVHPSAANFVLFRPPDPEGLLTYLAERGIAVRDMGHIEACEGHLRVTIGRPEDNDAFLEAVGAHRDAP